MSLLIWSILPITKTYGRRRKYLDSSIPRKKQKICMVLIDSPTFCKPFSTKDLYICVFFIFRLILPIKFLHLLLQNEALNCSSYPLYPARELVADKATTLLVFISLSNREIPYHLQPLLLLHAILWANLPLASDTHGSGSNYPRMGYRNFVPQCWIVFLVK